MTAAKRTEEKPGFLEIAYRVVQATLATLAVYRGARAALNAWKHVYEMVLSALAKDEEDETAVTTSERQSDVTQ